MDQLVTERGLCLLLWIDLQSYNSVILGGLHYCLEGEVV